MSTPVRPEISEKNKHWISKYRYYELKYFCLQYPDWKKVYYNLGGYPKGRTELPGIKSSGSVSNPTEDNAIVRAFLKGHMELVEKAAEQTSKELAPYILKAVTEGYSYNYLRMRMEIPCSKDTYYESYRKFYWLLSKTRN